MSTTPGSNHSKANERGSEWNGAESDNERGPEPDPKRAANSPHSAQAEIAPAPRPVDVFAQIMPTTIAAGGR